ncbi:MAG TPA: aminotransferase class I/II-fold pyridoxal phosphate-dependent enzyme [Acidisarcina sp.]
MDSGTPSTRDRVPHIETLAVHAGRTIDSATGAVVAPIQLSTTFEREADGTYPHGFSYSRDDNPNRKSLETCVAALEGGSAALAFSSGLAVATAILQGLRPGAHIVAPDDVYHGFRSVVAKVFANWDLEISYVDMSDPAQLEAALRPDTELIWVETPSNPLLKVTDLAEVARIALAAGVPTVCDGTFATPVLQHPLEYGIDMVAHSTTKYLSGHSDVLGGVLIAGKENALFASARQSQKLGGAVPSPFDCWLTLRGIETLPCRVRTQSASAMQVATFLNGHDGVEAVYYPGLANHPGHAVAARQMAAFGGVLSVRIAGGASTAIAVAAAVRVFTRATSLGGTHSLIEHRASIEGPASTTPQNLLRISVGLENPEDLIDDLAQALSAAGHAG